MSAAGRKVSSAAVDSDSEVAALVDRSAEISHLRKCCPTLDVHEAARLMKCHPDTLRKMAADRQIPATKIGRAWAFSERLLLEWFEARCKTGNPSHGRDDLSGRSVLATRLEAQLKQQNSEKQLSPGRK